MSSHNNNNNSISIGLDHSFVINGKKCHFSVTNHSIVWEHESTNHNNNNTRTTVIPLSQIISVWMCYCRQPNTRKLLCNCITNCATVWSDSNDSKPAHTSNSENVSVVRLYYAIPVGRYGWKVEFITLKNDTSLTNNDNALFDCLKRIRDLIDAFNRPKRLLVFVNPFGGTKKAPRVYAKKVLPIFQLSGIEIDCVVTEHANHAKDILLDSDICFSNFDGVICVGGDGMFSEILNGILIRTQRDNHINWSSIESAIERPKVILGVIPAGSTDAVAYGTTGINDPITSALHIVLGKTLNIDVCAIHHRDEDKLIRYATSFLGYGYFGDTIADSERNRWMGTKRYDWAGVKKFLGHRLYNGEIKLLIEPSDGSPKDTTICTAGCEQCAKASLRSRDSLNEDDSPACISIRGKFLAINAATMSCRCGMSKSGISPKAHLGNGCTDLILVSQCSRLDYLKYLLRTALSTKSPFDLGFVDVYRVREFEFNPIIGPTNKYHFTSASVWNCDGEVISEPAIHVKVHCQLITVFASGIELREQ